MNSAITVKKPTDRLLYLTTESKKTSAMYTTSGRITYGLTIRAASRDVMTKKTNNVGNQKVIFSVDGYHLLKRSHCTKLLYLTIKLFPRDSAFVKYLQLLAKNGL